MRNYSEQEVIEVVKLQFVVEQGYANLFDISDDNRRNNAINLAYTVIPRYKQIAPKTLAAVRGMNMDAVLDQAMLVAETGAILAEKNPRKRISFLETATH